MTERIHTSATTGSRETETAFDTAHCDRRRDGPVGAGDTRAHRLRRRVRALSVDDRFARRGPVEIVLPGGHLSEGLTKPVKLPEHRESSSGAARQNGRLVVRVVDDGVGGAAPGIWSGLAGIADRVATPTAELPCAS